MSLKYSIEIHDESQAVKTMLESAKVSFKKTREASNTLRTRTLPGAINYLHNVLKHKECVPFRRFNTGCGQTRQAKKFGETRGRWPKKSCEVLIQMLEKMKEEAVERDIDCADLVIGHIQVSRAPKIFGRTFRAYGRVTPFNKSPCHIQIVAFKKQVEIIDDEDKIVRIE